MDKKVTQSLTIIGGFGTLVIQSLIGFGVIPAEATGAANDILLNLTELVRNIFTMIGIYGARRAMSSS